MRLYPEEIVAYDVANAQQSHGQLYRALLSHTVGELVTGVGTLSKSVGELQSVQHAHTERLDSVAQKVEQLSLHQVDVLSAVQQVVQQMQVAAQAAKGAELPDDAKALSPPRSPRLRLGSCLTLARSPSMAPSLTRSASMVSCGTPGGVLHHLPPSTPPVEANVDEGEGPDRTIRPSCQMAPPNSVGVCPTELREDL